MTFRIFTKIAGYMTLLSLFFIPSFATEEWSYRILNTHPHDESCFTQGLLFQNGLLLESCGLYARSKLQLTLPASGKIVKQVAVSPRYFAEGLLASAGRILLLTWKAGKVLVLDGDSWRQVGEHPLDGEGWGLSRMNRRLVLSNGSDSLSFLDERTLQVTEKLGVSANGKAVTQLNELEWDEKFLYANIWQSDSVAVIFPETGVLRAWWNLSGLRERALLSSAGKVDVLNGIAWDKERNVFWVTGKFWPVIFEIQAVKP